MLGDEIVNSLSEALTLVLTEFGTGILHEPKRFLSVIRDIYDPTCETAEMQILIRNCDEDLFEHFNRALSLEHITTQDLQQAAKSTCKVLTGQRMIASSAAESFSNELLKGISQFLAQTNRLDGPAPTPVPSAPPKAAPAPSPQATYRTPATKSSDTKQPVAQTPKATPAPSAQATYRAPAVKPPAVKTPVTKPPVAQPATSADDNKPKGKAKLISFAVAIVAVAALIAIVANSTSRKPSSQTSFVNTPSSLSKGARVVETSVSGEGEVSKTVNDWDGGNTGLVIMVKNNSNVDLDMDLSYSFESSSGSKIQDGTDTLFSIGPGETGCFADLECYADIPPTSVSYTINSTESYETSSSLEGNVRVKEVEVNNGETIVRLSNTSKQNVKVFEVTMLVKTPNGLTFDSEDSIWVDLKPGEDAETSIKTGEVSNAGFDVKDCERTYYVVGYCSTPND